MSMHAFRLRQAWTACGRPADRVDNANGRVAHARPQAAHPCLEPALSDPKHALRA